MAYNSANVSAGDTGLASQYNNLRDDVLFNAGDYAVTTGSAGAYVLSLDSSIALTTGQKVRFKANHASPGASTINVNGLGAVSIIKSSGSAIGANDIAIDALCEVTYDGTSFQLVNTLPSGGGGFTTIENTIYNSSEQLTGADIDGTTYTHTFGSYGDILTVSDGVTTDTINRDTQGRITSITTA